MSDAQSAIHENQNLLEACSGGIFTILVTPFDDSEQIDEKSLRRLVDYNIEAGVHGLGISYPGEIDKLTASERTAVIATIIEQTDNRVPVIVNVSAPGNWLANSYAEEAHRLGASAVMAMPPSPRIDKDEVHAFYQGIARAADLPIFLQSSGDRAIPAHLVREIAETNQYVQFAKVDAEPPVEHVKAAVECTGNLLTILGGASGRFFIEELRLGARGTTPWPSRPHAFVKVWNQWRTNDTEASEATFNREIAPLLTTPGLDHKEILRREGVLATSRWRSPGPAPVDPESRRQLNVICERLGIGHTSSKYANER